jgi:hypothetical protein
MRFRGDDYGAELTVDGVRATVEFLAGKLLAHCDYCDRDTGTIGGIVIEPIHNEFVPDWCVNLICGACLISKAASFPHVGVMQ